MGRGSRGGVGTVLCNGRSRKSKDKEEGKLGKRREQ